MKAQAGEIALFLAGLGAGIAVLGFELLIFAGSLLATALGQASQVIATATGAPAPAMIPFALIFIIVDIVQNFGIGFLAHEAFSFGFLIGDLLMLVLIGTIAWSIAPSIVIGMFIAFIVVIIGMAVKPRNS